MMKTELEKQNQALVLAMAKTNKALLILKRHIKLSEEGKLESDEKPLTTDEIKSLGRIIGL